MKYLNYRVGGSTGFDTQLQLFLDDVGTVENHRLDCHVKVVGWTDGWMADGGSAVPAAAVKLHGGWPSSSAAAGHVTARSCDQCLLTSLRCIIDEVDKSARVTVSTVLLGCLLPPRRTL